LGIILQLLTIFLSFFYEVRKNCTFSTSSYHETNIFE